MKNVSAPTPLLSYLDLIEIVEMFRATSHFNELRLKSGELELEVRRGGSPAPQREPIASERSSPGQPAEAPAQRAHSGGSAATAGAASSPRAVKVTSPMVGTFYCAPEPGAAPFVQRGQKVEADTTLCIVEVMKLMNTITAGHAGVVADILVQDGQPVEYGQLLMVIEPN